MTALVVLQVAVGAAGGVLAGVASLALLRRQVAALTARRPKPSPFQGEGGGEGENPLSPSSTGPSPYPLPRGERRYGAVVGGLFGRLVLVAGGLSATLVWSLWCGLAFAVALVVTRQVAIWRVRPVAPTPSGAEETHAGAGEPHTRMRSNG